MKRSLHDILIAAVGEWVEQEEILWVDGVCEAILTLIELQEEVKHATPN